MATVVGKKTAMERSSASSDHDFTAHGHDFSSAVKDGKKECKRIFRAAAAEKYSLVFWWEDARKIQGKLWYAVTIAISGDSKGKKGKTNAAIRKIVKMKGYRTGYRRRPSLPPKKFASDLSTRGIFGSRTMVRRRKMPRRALSLSRPAV